jgi:peptidoglycan/LPS O-acetylase OafA/YrhL
MQCRNCGTEIADKAIVCFRCGASTTDPVRRPAIIKPKRSPLVALVIMALLILLALYLGQASRTAANPDNLRLAAGVCLGAAVAVLLVRILRRR